MEVFYHPEHRAEQIAPEASWAMISITDPGRTADLRPGWEKILRVEFEDAWYSEKDILFYKNEARTLLSGCIQEDQARRIVAFVDSLPGAGIQQLHVHCYHGRSRSHAVAKYAAKRLGTQVESLHPAFNTCVYAMLENPAMFRKAWNLVDAEARTEKPIGFLDLLARKIRGR